MEEMTILIILLVVAIFLKLKYKEILYHSRKERLSTTLIIFIVMMGWELHNKYIGGAWIFPGPGMIGIYILGLPVELYLFYIIGPYLMFASYETIHVKLDKKDDNRL